MSQESLNGNDQNPFSSKDLEQIRATNPIAECEQPPQVRPIIVVDFDGSLAGEIGKPGVIYRRARPLK
ncbi:MAG: hypothetical protein Q7R53_02935 [bacterium]|nr:hypothetical protein [bacterium]